ncbi:unnamed protein product [Lasius platythorax]|uniref:Reverse transcriptase Ty1/copia-type domain-containing protein n=1 Tax=Lasius platythorax TaxID=488582 RepID=A0AAV2NP19_9HYME
MLEQVFLFLSSKTWIHKTSEADPCLYIRNENGKLLLVALYVDDGLVVAIDQEDSKTFIEERRSLRLLQNQLHIFWVLKLNASMMVPLRLVNKHMQRRY